MHRQTEPLPRDTVRDVLGIARALYATRKGDRAASDELAKLAEAGALPQRSDLKDADVLRCALTWSRGCGEMLTCPRNGRDAQGWTCSG